MPDIETGTCQSLPTFETSEMVERGGCRIRSMTVRNLLSLEHYRFGMFLWHKANEAGVVVLPINEAYTTKTSRGPARC